MEWLILVRMKWELFHFLLYFIPLPTPFLQFKRNNNIISRCILFLIYIFFLNSQKNIFLLYILIEYLFYFHFGYKSIIVFQSNNMSVINLSIIMSKAKQNPISGWSFQHYVNILQLTLTDLFSISSLIFYIIK